MVRIHQRRYIMRLAAVLALVAVTFVAQTTTSPSLAAVSAAAPTTGSAFPLSQGPLSRSVLADCEAIFTRSGDSQADACVNGVELRARGYLKCLKGQGSSSALKLLYNPNDCYGGENSDKYYMEAIAQARFVVLKDGAVEGSQVVAGGWVSDYTQWEVSYDAETLRVKFGVSESEIADSGLANLSGRIDVVLVSRPQISSGTSGMLEPASNPMGLVELKRADNGNGAQDAAIQVNRYLTAMQLAGFSGTYLVDTLSYHDYFEVTRQCTRENGSKYDRTEGWTVTGPTPGVLVVTKTHPAICDDDNNQSPPSSGGNETGVGEAIGAEDPALVPVPAPNPSEGEDACDYQCKAGAAAALITASALIKALVDKYIAAGVVRGAAFESVKATVCLGVVNVATHGPGDGSVSTEAATCYNATNIVAFALLLQQLLDAGLLTEEQLQELLDEAPSGVGGTEGDGSQSGNAGGQSPPARAQGDPRLRTLDGLNYDFHAVGEFQLLEHPASDFAVQARLIPAERQMSSIGAIAFRARHVLIEVSPSGILVDGEPYSLPSGEMHYLGDGVTIVSNSPGEVRVASPYDHRGLHAIVIWQTQPGGRGDVSVSVPNAWAGELQGLLGDFDGDLTNELLSSTGTDVTSSLEFGASDVTYLQRLYGTFGDSWRVSDTTSAFTYGPGQSTATFTDMSYPGSITKLGDLTQAEFMFGTAACTSAGVPVGVNFDDCVLDVGVSGDASFAESIAAGGTFGVSADHATTVDGRLVVDFNEEVPPNFYTRVVSNRPSVGNLVYSGTSSPYRFHVGQLEAHDGVTLTFNVASTSAVLVEDMQFSPLPTGATVTAGEPVSAGIDGDVVTPVVIWLPHFKASLGASLWVTTGASRPWAGITSVQVDLDRVPAQRFDVALPFSSGGLEPGSGAGVLEAPGSEDLYCIAATAVSRDVLFRMAPTSSAIAFQVLDPAGLVVGSGTGNSAASVDAELLGDQELCARVFWTGDSAPDRTRYVLEAEVMPDPQVFAVDLGDVRVMSKRGLGSGARTLETSASRDDYVFTVPAGGQRVRMEWTQLMGASAYAYNRHLGLALVDSSGAVVWSIADVGDTYAVMDVELAEGQYTFQVSGIPTATSGWLTGPYDFVLYGVSPALAQSFPVDLSVGGVERTVTTGGGGVIETSLSSDTYEFTVPANSALVARFNVNYPTSATPPLMWVLKDAAGTAIMSDSLNQNRIVTVPNLSGSYTLTVSPTSFPMSMRAPLNAQVSLSRT